jgi:hypothetical protein
MDCPVVVIYETTPEVRDVLVSGDPYKDRTNPPWVATECASTAKLRSSGILVPTDRVAPAARLSGKQAAPLPREEGSEGGEAWNHSRQLPPSAAGLRQTTRSIATGNKHVASRPT